MGILSNKNKLDVLIALNIVNENAQSKIAPPTTHVEPYPKP